MQIKTEKAPMKMLFLINWSTDNSVSRLFVGKLCIDSLWGSATSTWIIRFTANLIQ